MFLIPLDRRREWYRYHALFREFLLGELRRVEPDVIEKLHLRAADWYESNGSPAMALEHLLNTTERDRCVQLVTELVLPTYQAGQMSTVQRWLSALGDAAIEDYPPLAVLAGWIAALTGQTAEAERWAAIVDAASFDLVPLDGSASFDSARAMLRAVMCPAGPEQMMADASFAVAQEPPWSPWRDTALVPVRRGASARRRRRPGGRPVRGGVRGGRRDVQHRHVRRSARPSWRCWRWTAGAGRRRPSTWNAPSPPSRSTGCTTTPPACSPSPPRLGLLCTAATRRRPTASSRGRCGPARVHVRVAVPRRAGPAAAGQGLLAIGDQRPPATCCARSTTSCSTGRPSAPSSTRSTEFRRSSPRARSRERPAVTPLTPAELRLLPYLQTHLTIGEIGERLFVSRNTVSSEVGSIYRKLGVSSRNDAVEQATAIGLLGG